jgi:hypothetical protein
MKTIDIESAEAVAKKMDGYISNRFITSKVELIAAASPIYVRIRAGRPHSDSYWIDATNELSRSLPGNPTDAENEIKRLASIALGDPRLLEDLARKRQGEQKLAEAQAEIAAAEHAPLERIAKRQSVNARYAHLHRLHGFWSQNFAGFAEGHLSFIADNVGVVDAFTGMPVQSCHSSFQEVMKNRILAELAPAKLAGLEKALAHIGAQLESLGMD